MINKIWPFSTISSLKEELKIEKRKNEKLLGDYINADYVVKLYAPKPQSMNVATTGTLVMYDRTIKQIK